MLAGLAARDSVHFLFLFLVSAHFSVRGTAPFLLAWEWDLAIFTPRRLCCLSLSLSLSLSHFFLLVSCIRCNFFGCLSCQFVSVSLPPYSKICQLYAGRLLFSLSPSAPRCGSFSSRRALAPSRCRGIVNSFLPLMPVSCPLILLCSSLPPRGPAAPVAPGPLLFFSPCAINRAWGILLVLSLICLCCIPRSR